MTPIPLSRVFPSALPRWGHPSPAGQHARRYYPMVPHSMPTLAWATQQITTCRGAASSSQATTRSRTWHVLGWNATFAICRLSSAGMNIKHAVMLAPRLSRISHMTSVHVVQPQVEPTVMSSLHCWVPRRLASLLAWGRAPFPEIEVSGRQASVS
ncbi:hypothetical protein J3F83DRAFT_305606 [Trichoderma novae-zelandiae]